MHADIELAERLRDGKVPELPDHEPNRSFVFMDIAIASKPAGKDMHVQRVTGKHAA